MGIGFYMVLVMSSFNDWIAYFFHFSLNATTWAGRILLLAVPPIAYFLTYRWCIGLQRSDRAVLQHGVETGIVRRLPHGEFVEVHQPLAGVDSHGHPIELEYQGAAVPKKLNQLGYAGNAASGSLLRPDRQDETARTRRRRTATCSRRRTTSTGAGGSSPVAPTRADLPTPVRSEQVPARRDEWSGSPTVRGVAPPAERVMVGEHRIHQRRDGDQHGHARRRRAPSAPIDARGR